MLRNKKLTHRQKLPYKLGALLLLAILGCSYTLYTNQGEKLVNVGYYNMGRGLLQNDTIAPTDPPIKLEYEDHEGLTLEQIKNGGFILHLLGVMWMFIALAIICDDYFVPSLTVIQEGVGMGDDIAGATLMAAGGSAPELFTSFIGTFAGSTVGIGTIVGSAVFNILFVIGCCALVSKEALALTWWPLARDSLFYVIDLALLTVFFGDSRIYLYEAIIQFALYLLYVLFMKYNSRIEVWFKNLIGKPDDEEEKGRIARQKDLAKKYRKSGALFSSGVYKIMFNEVDAKGKGPEQGKDNRFKRAGMMMLDKVQQEEEDEKQQTIEEEEEGPKGCCGKVTFWITKIMGYPLEIMLMYTIPKFEEGSVVPSGPLACKYRGVADDEDDKADEDKKTDGDDEADEDKKTDGDDKDGEDSEEEKPAIKPALGCAIFGFLMSIVWIGIFSYFMVWWATTLAQISGIPPVIVGLTFLAAGTSVPDLLSSMAVARLGFGDMAVSSSIGSNIFDVTVGLPLPWMFFILIKNTGYVDVQADGIGVSILTLLIMMALVIGAIAISKWKMSKRLGWSMFVLYFFFVTFSCFLSFCVFTNGFSGCDA